LVRVVLWIVHHDPVLIWIDNWVPTNVVWAVAMLAGKLAKAIEIHVKFVPCNYVVHAADLCGECLDLALNPAFAEGLGAEVKGTRKCTEVCSVDVDVPTSDATSRTRSTVLGWCIEVVGSKFLQVDSPINAASKVEALPVIASCVLGRIGHIRDIVSVVKYDVRVGGAVVETLGTYTAPKDLIEFRESNIAALPGAPSGCCI
tara:strand:+ start:4586 stop:5191 length:606 start_codon:yes stop_codon:yes gene_type:complete